MTSSVVVVAEAVLPPNGSGDAALGLVRAAADAGADVLRFTCPGPAADVPGLECEAWTELRKATLKAGLDFLATAATEADVDMLAGVGILGWSVHAGAGVAVLEAAARTHLPVFLRADWTVGVEGTDAAALLGRYDLDLTVLHQPAARPTPPEGLALDVLAELRARRFPRVGFCDRSARGWPSLAAVTLGADVVEVPLALSPYLPGVAEAGAVEPPALASTVAGARYLAWARAHPGLGFPESHTGGAAAETFEFNS